MPLSTSEQQLLDFVKSVGEEGAYPSQLQRFCDLHNLGYYQPIIARLLARHLVWLDDYRRVGMGKYSVTDLVSMSPLTVVVENLTLTMEG